MVLAGDLPALIFQALAEAYNEKAGAENVDGDSIATLLCNMMEDYAFNGSWVSKEEGQE